MRTQKQTSDRDTDETRVSGFLTPSSVMFSTPANSFVIGSTPNGAELTRYLYQYKSRGGFVDQALIDKRWGSKTEGKNENRPNVAVWIV